MALEKRGKYWYIRLQVGGTRIERSTKTACIAEAKAIHARVEKEARNHVLHGARPEYKFSDAILKWSEVAQRDGLASFDDNLTRSIWLMDNYGGLKINQIDNEIINEIIKHRSSITYFEKGYDENNLKIKVEKTRKATNATINRYLQLIRRILKLAKEQFNMVDSIPTFKLLPENNQLERWLTPEKAHELLMELPPHLRDMAAFALQTGLRDRNITQLQWQRVDLVKRHAWINATSSKSKKPIAIPLNGTAVEILRRQIGKNSHYVFTYQGQPIERCNNSAWKRAIRKLDMKGFRFHDLRHTWASWHIQNGTSLHELQQLGGWASYKMVLRYAHFSSEHLKNAAERISGIKVGYIGQEQKRTNFKCLIVK